MKYAVINQDNSVINCIEWDGVTPWQPPQGCFVVADENVHIGDRYNPTDNSFERTVMVEKEE